MARLTSMTDDTYEYDPKKFSAIGLKTNRAIRLGDAVRYRVERADLEERQLDFVLLKD
jgi:ribonuclease R